MGTVGIGPGLVGLFSPIFTAITITITIPILGEGRHCRQHDDRCEQRGTEGGDEARLHGGLPMSWTDAATKRHRGLTIGEIGPCDPRPFSAGQRNRFQFGFCADEVAHPMAAVRVTMRHMRIADVVAYVGTQL